MAKHTTYPGAIGIRMERFFTVWLKLTKREKRTLARSRQLLARANKGFALADKMLAATNTTN